MEKRDSARKSTQVLSRVGDSKRFETSSIWARSTSGNGHEIRDRIGLSKIADSEASRENKIYPEKVSD